MKFYLMGVVGVGKSSLRENLHRRFPEASVYEEWPEPMAIEVGQSHQVLDSQQREDIQSWIFTQLARKNALVSADKAPTIIIDRSPLDTFAFYPHELWPEKARQLLDALLQHAPALPLAQGQLIFLRGDAEEIAVHMDRSRSYTTESIARQQAAFEYLVAWLERRGTRAYTVDTQGLNPEQVTALVADYINAARDPQPDLQLIVEEIAGSANASPDETKGTVPNVLLQQDIWNRPLCLIDQLKHVPVCPGVYLWKDARDRVLYVGKSKELRKRMRQYLAGHDSREWIPRMMAQVTGFDYVVTASEAEALMMEITLINQLSPPFNVDFRDDKSYPYIALTLEDAYPAIKYTRERKRPGTRYFGPYTDARGARETVDTLRRVIPLCRETCPEYKRVRANGFMRPLPRACFDAQLGHGPGVCALQITAQEYGESVQRAVSLLEGNSASLERDLAAAMEQAADALNYELAARMRNRLEGLKSIKQRQTVVSDSHAAYDVVGFEREETIAAAYVLIVREGKVLHSNEFVLDKGLNVSFDELASSFIARYYHDAGQVPAEIICELELEDRAVLEDFLTTRRREACGNVRAGKVQLTVPSRGTKKKLLDMARQNAAHALLRFKVRTHYDDERLNAALLQLESALALDAPPLRIESFDISTLHGTHSVGSMVVFSNGRADKAAYRRFKIRAEHDEANDVAMMREVLERRFAPGRLEDERFGRVPDLLLIDGGKPQLSAVSAVLEELGIGKVAVAGLAKREEELWTDWSDEPIMLADGSPSLYLVKRIRDEAHRFAIEYHRKLRSKALTASILDEVPGIGPKRRRALIKHFGSFKNLRTATIEQLATAPGISQEIAQDLHDLLHLQ